jgi:hypothetical protein
MPCINVLWPSANGIKTVTNPLVPIPPRAACLFDQRDLAAHAARCDRRSNPGRPTADDDDVKTLFDGQLAMIVQSFHFSSPVSYARSEFQRCRQPEVAGVHSSLPSL